jgi:hypothetical protein
MSEGGPLQFLSYTDVTALLGVATGSLGRVNLPPPDVMVGSTRGWSEETIVAWKATRPGRGKGGGRPPHRKPGEEEFA